MKPGALLLGAVVWGCLATAPAAEYCHAVDASLTNGLGWTFSEGFQYAATQKAYGFRAKGASISSPEFDFVITQLVATVKGASAATEREVSLHVSPTGAMQPVVYGAEYTDFTVEYPFEDGIRSFSIIADGGGSGNVYLSSITLRGISYVPEPSEIFVSGVSTDSCTLCWLNPAGTVSNLVRVYQRDCSPDLNTRFCVCSFDFLEGPKSGSPRNCAESVGARHPELEGTRLYAPTGMDGVLQVGTGDALGTLVLPVVEDYADAVLRLEVKAHPTDASFRQLCIGCIEGGITNQLTAVALPTEDFGRLEIDVSAAPAGSRIVINCDSVKSNRRLLVKSIELLHLDPVTQEFVQEAEVVCEGAEPVPQAMRIRVEWLRPQSEYRFGIVAYTETSFSGEALSAIIAIPSVRPPAGTLLLFASGLRRHTKMLRGTIERVVERWSGGGVEW